MGYVGESIKRVEDPRFIQGRGKYVANLLQIFAQFGIHFQSHVLQPRKLIPVVEMSYWQKPNAWSYHSFFRICHDLCGKIPIAFMR